MKKKTTILELCIIFLLSLTPMVWLKGNQIILGHDSGFRLNPVQHLLNLVYSWDFTFNFGADWSVFKGFLITQFPETIFTVISRSLAIGETISFILWFFLIGISMYILVNSFFPKKEYWIFRLSSAVFYMYNFFLLQGWFIAERAKFSIYAALPLGVLILYKTLTRSYSLMKGTILFSIVAFFLNGGGNPTLYGSLIIAYSFEFLYLTLINFLQRGSREILYSLKVAIFFVLGFILINAYWVFPQFYLVLNRYSSSLAATGGVEGIINWEAMVNKQTSFINLFRLQGIPDWYNNSSHVYANDFLNNPFLIVFSFIPVLIIIFGFYYHKQISGEVRNDKILYLITSLYFVGLMFSAGSHPPLGFAYIFLIQKIPGFAIFRSAFYKFGTILWFSSIFLTCCYINLFIIKFAKNKFRVNLVGVVVILFILLYHYPYFSGSFFDWNKPLTTRVQVPEYVHETANYLNQSKDRTIRILLLPQLEPAYHADRYEWGYFSLDALPRLAINHSIVTNDTSSPPIVSAIYDAISQNDERTFLRLAGLVGINKILWREDISNNDKNVSTADVLMAETNIAHFSGVSLEKQFGKWKVYAINSQLYLPHFYIPSWIINTQSQEAFIGDIIADTDSARPAVLFSNALTNKNKGLQSLFKQTTVRATCIMCEHDAFDEKQQGVTIPNVKLLPDSPFYFLVSQKEKKLITTYGNESVQLIDADLSLANKRLAELKQMIDRRSNEPSKILVDDAIAKYKTLITDALDRSFKLPIDAQNTALIKILYYLKAQYHYLSLVGDKTGFTQDSLDDLAPFMADLMSNLSSQVWITSATSGQFQFKYMFTLADDGMYNIKIKETKGNQLIKFIVDDKELPDLKNNYFTAGIHKLNVVYEFPKNVLANGLTTQSGKLDLQMGNKVKLSLTNFSDQGIYAIRFNYKVTKGVPRLSIIEGSGYFNQINRMQLEQNSSWNTFYYEFKPTRGNDYAYLQFYSRGFDLYGAELEIKDLVINQIFSPQVFLSNTLSQAEELVPQISYEKIDQTKYAVHVREAVHPYLLSFGENYDGGWKVYLPDTHASISEADHLIVNGYANGWLISRAGNYDMVIEYRPQRLFYTGLIISGASIFFILFAILYKKSHDKN